MLIAAPDQHGEMFFIHEEEVVRRAARQRNDVFPFTGTPLTLKGLGEQGCRFSLVFDPRVRGHGFSAQVTSLTPVPTCRLVLGDSDDDEEEVFHLGASPR